MGSTTDFATLRNLAFYSGYSPSYFYFKSLINYKSDREEYNAKAQKIVAEATSFLSKMPSFAKDDETLVAEQINTLITFIENAVTREQSNEIAYFQNKIKLFKSTDGLKDDPIVKELQQYLSPNNFKYDKIITLINVLLQGVENTSAIVKHEIQHIEEINTAMNNLHKARESQLKGLWNSGKASNAIVKYKGNVEDYLSAARKRFDRDILIDYTNNGNLYSTLSPRKFIPGAKKWLSKIQQSTDVIIGHWITDSIHEIIESPQNYAKFIEIIKQECGNILEESPEEAETKIKQYLIITATVYATKHIGDILNGIYSTLNVSELADMIATSIKDLGELHIEGLYDNFGMFGKTIELFKNAKTKADLEKNSAKALYEALLDFREELRQMKKGDKLTPEQQFLKKALKIGSDDDKYRAIYTLIAKLEKLQKNVEYHSKLSKEEFEKWLKGQNFSISGNEANSKVTINITLTEDGKIDIPAIINQLNSSRAIKNLGDRRSEANSLEGLIQGLKTRVSHSIKTDLIQAITPLTNLARKKGLGGEQYVINAIKQAIENKKISVGGPTFSEIKQGIQESLRSNNNLNDWTGKLNKKNDFVVTVTIDDETPDLKKAFEQMIENDAEVIAENISEKLKEITNSYVSDFVLNFQNKMKKNQSDEKSFNSYKANADSFFEAAQERNTLYKDINDISVELGKTWDEYEKTMRNAGIKAEIINKKKEQILHSFENSFYQSSTMKTYNQYQNNIGFIGGSLGANILSQLNNINEIFTAAGMPMSDADITWLQSAIINCSPNSIVGEKHKNIIEDYLGAMAAFALFDEGGAEAEIINNTSERLKESYSTPNILHLYAVNSIYVPGSYVLSKVLEELKTCAANAYTAYESQRKGATIAIINPVTEAIVPNRGANINIQDPPDKNPWGTVANSAAHMVKLKILFLAGLLDIAHDINKTLTNIQLPT